MLVDVSYINNPVHPYIVSALGIIGVIFVISSLGYLFYIDDKESCNVKLSGKQIRGKKISYCLMWVAIFFFLCGGLYIAFDTFYIAPQRKETVKFIIEEKYQLKAVYDDKKKKYLNLYNKNNEYCKTLIIEETGEAGKFNISERIKNED